MWRQRRARPAHGAEAALSERVRVGEDEQPDAQRRETRARSGDSDEEERCGADGTCVGRRGEAGGAAGRPGPAGHGACVGICAPRLPRGRRVAAARPRRTCMALGHAAAHGSGLGGARLPRTPSRSPRPSADSDEDLSRTCRTPAHPSISIAHLTQTGNEQTRLRKQHPIYGKSECWSRHGSCSFGLQGTRTFGEAALRPEDHSGLALRGQLSCVIRRSAADSIKTGGCLACTSASATCALPGPAPSRHCRPSDADACAAAGRRDARLSEPHKRPHCRVGLRTRSGARACIAAHCVREVQENFPGWCISGTLETRGRRRGARPEGEGGAPRRARQAARPSARSACGAHASLARTQARPSPLPVSQAPFRQLMRSRSGFWIRTTLGPRKTCVGPRGASSGRRRRPPNCVMAIHSALWRGTSIGALQACGRRLASMPLRPPEHRWPSIIR
jgi:hypothetical protein